MALPRLLCIAAFCVPLFSAAFAAVPDVVDRELVHPAALAAAVELTYSSNPSRVGVHTAFASLDAAAETLAGLGRLQVQVSTFGTSPQAKSARILQRGASCGFTAFDPHITDHGLLSFEPDPGCVLTTGSDLRLEIFFEGPGRITLWGYPLEPDEQAPLTIRSLLGDGNRWAVAGRSVRWRSEGTTRRLELMAYVWNVSTRFALFLLVGVAATASAGILLLPPEGSRWLAPTLRSSLGSALVVLAVTATHAFATPPLQAPDEPAHLLALSNAIERPAIQSDVQRLAERTHFERIRFHPAEGFAPHDMTEGYAAAWNDHAPAVAYLPRRSSTTWYLWHGAGHLLPEMDAAGTLLAMRMLNALLCAVATGLAVALLAMSGMPGSPPLFLLPILVVPAAPFFAVALSNYAVLVTATLLFGAVILALYFDGDLSHFLGPPLGVSSAFLLASSHNALPLAPLLAAVLVARIALGTNRCAAPWTCAAVFWGGFFTGLQTFWLLANPQYTAEMFGFLAIRAPRILLVSADYVGAHPILWVPIAAACAAAEGLVARATAGRDLRHYRRLALWGLAATAAVIVGINVVAVLIGWVPSVPNIELRLVDRAQYVADVLLTTAAMPGPGRGDIFVSSTFWGGFGWVDTLIPRWLQALVVLATGGAALFGALRVVAAGRGRSAVFLLLLALGGAISLAMLAVASHSMARNLHGRYLIALYMTIVILGFAEVIRRDWQAGSRVPTLLLAAGLAIQGSSVVVILARYY